MVLHSSEVWSSLLCICNSACFARIWINLPACSNVSDHFIYSTHIRYLLRFFFSKRYLEQRCGLPRLSQLLFPFFSFSFFPLPRLASKIYLCSSPFWAVVRVRAGFFHVLNVNKSVALWTLVGWYWLSGELPTQIFPHEVFLHIFFRTWFWERFELTREIFFLCQNVFCPKRLRGRFVWEFWTETAVPTDTVVFFHMTWAYLCWTFVVLTRFWRSILICPCHVAFALFLSLLLKLTGIGQKTKCQGVKKLLNTTSSRRSAFLSSRYGTNTFFPSSVCSLTHYWSMIIFSCLPVN